MIKNDIITSVLKNLRDSLTDEGLRSSTYADDQNDVAAHLEGILQDAGPGADIRTCADFIHLNVECCDTCHSFGFPYDMSPMVELKAGGHAWICCAIERALGEDIAAKNLQPQMRIKPAGYKPFADFFGARDQNNDAK